MLDFNGFEMRPEAAFSTVVFGPERNFRNEFSNIAFLESDP